MAGFDFNTAVDLARDMRKRRKGVDDLNERGRNLLQGLESELRRRGFSSFREYESKERERVGRNEGLRRSVVSGRERSQALGVEAQAEEDVDEKTKIQKQATRAGRAADITEGILARRTALSPQQGMPTQAPPKPSPSIGRRIGQAVGTAADVAYRNTVGRIPGAEQYLEAPVGRPGGNLAYALGLATGQKTRYNYETNEVTDEQGNPLRAPTRANVLQAATGAAIAEPGRVVSGVRAGGRPPLAPKTLPPAPIPKVQQAAREAAPMVQRTPTAIQSAPPRGALRVKVKAVRPDVEPPTQRVVFPMGGGAERQRANIMHTTPTIINRVTGTNLGSEMLRVRSLEEPLAGTRNVALRQAELLKLSAQEDANLLRTLRGAEAPMSPRVSRIAQEFRAMTEEDAADYLKRGAQVMDQPILNPTTGQLEPTYRPFVPRQNYVPETVDATRVAKMSVQKLHQAVRRANPQMPPQVAADIAVGLRARAMGEEAVGISAEATRMLRAGRSTPSHLHARVEFQLPEEIIRPMREAIPHYIHDSARERAMLQVYGPADERVRSALNQAAQSGHPDAKLAIEAWNRFRGITQDSPVSERVGQVTRVLGNSASAMFLGIPTAVKQFTQAAPVLANLPTRRVAMGFVKAFTQGGRYEAERAGAVIDDLLRDAVQSRAQLPTATTLDRLERFTGRVASEVVKRSGIARADSLLRTATFHAAQSELTALRDAAFRGSRGALKKLQREGLTATSTTDDITKTAKRLADELNLRAGNLDMPYMLTTPGYAFARQLNSFTIGMTGMINKRYLMPLVSAARKKDPRAMAEAVTNIGKLTVAGTVVGEAVESALQALQGRKEDRAGGTLSEFIEGIQAGKVPSSVVIARMKDDLATAALLGYLQTINEAMKSYNPEARLYGAVAGAGVSNVAEIESLTRNLVTAPAGKQKARAQRQALRGAVRRVPGVGGILAPRLFPSRQ